MKDIYKHVLENDLIRPMKNGTIYRFNKYKNKFIEAPQIPFGTKKKYRVVTATINSKLYHLYVHRLVALTYIPNPENKPTVNHIDGDPSNNNLKNLEWATYSEQVAHAYETGLIDHMKNAVECICGDLTRADDGICSNCKHEIEIERKRKQRTEQTRRELELIDLRTLNFREKEIIYQRYLGKSYEEIGAEYEISRQRVEQIINAAKLKVFIEPVFPNLVKHIVDKEIGMSDLAYWCNLSKQTLENRLNGKAEWKLSEAITIREKLNAKQSLEQLFYRIDDIATNE